MQFDRNKFAEAIGSSFVLKEEDGRTVNLELLEVSEVKDRSNQISFSIVFLAPESDSIGQGLYEVEHETLGPLHLFLVPVGIKDGRIELESVFNLLKQA
jgi:hypothetical protein